MIEYNLTKALREFLTETLKTMELETVNGTTRPPAVVNGYLPPKRYDDESEDFPFVIVRYRDSTSELETTVVKVELIVGCYYAPEDENGNVIGDFDGHDICLNVMGRIRTALCELPARTLARKYQLRMPIDSETPEEQPAPQWQLVMNTTWVINTPRNIDDF